ncbi:hypothetical protein N7499_001229 [Penicillium canescens]|uniref:Uncharacterized protein n=1 Tax=Penicillium canescens TaxID=5083 RepID=A0AAD6I2J9_PENCN|nr:uncharacterized protein N7446_003632 [Penicillium canescens]KAJ6027771.1 hypothetical protein N7460_012588 [Penicillium canescens]KAJ6041051.1 hypothetical protein N7444_009956 [Penicillium canescens]KAJ6066595.1 hypothetical protein N7446_003632 [Penicillium canescens]KAJ6101599.1 hypothetical protein N7499_001229 [Penicillium canescens]KAJ6174059.1 hypothetical protein N7485_006871 [Penicillium canescens]
MYMVPVLDSTTLFCWMIAVRSILASAEPQGRVAYEPGAMVSYVNVFGASFGDPSILELESKYENYYRGMARVHLDCLFDFADCCKYIEDKYVFNMVFTDGQSTRVQPKDMFLFSPDQVVKRTASITEREYIERQ